MYDAIIVGARCAGSATALLLARSGLRVLLVDRATFPSDTISTHQIQIPGSVALRRWGLLDKVLATEPGEALGIRFDTHGAIIDASYPTMDGIHAIYSPRRIILDKILLDAAVEAGAEVREGFITEDLVWEDGRVVGIRGRSKDGSSSVTERAKVVIGADGKHSLVAKQVNAPKYDEYPVYTCAYYSYWDNLPTHNKGEIYVRDKRFVGLWPTNHNQTIVFVCWPAHEFDTFRTDVEGNYLGTLNLVPEVADRLQQATRTERIVGSGDTPNFYRKPYGPGWALVGDAGYVKDPVSAMGINDAFASAQLLADALDAGFTGRQPMDTALSRYEQARNTLTKPFYDFTLDAARMEPYSLEKKTVLNALQYNAAAASQFVGIFACVVKPQDFFTPQNLFQILGTRGMSRIILSKLLRRAS